MSATQQLLQFPWQRPEQCSRKGRVGVRGKSKEERRGRVCVGVCGWVLEATEGEAAAGVVRQREFRGHSLYFFVGMSLREAAKQTRKCRGRRKNKQRGEPDAQRRGEAWKIPPGPRWAFYKSLFIFSEWGISKVLWVAALNVHFKSGKTPKTNPISYLFTQFYAPDCYKYKQKRRKEGVQVHDDTTHFAVQKNYSRYRRGKNCRDKVISTKNSFSYENISIKFSMYQVHTKSIKVCRISKMIQYKKKQETKKQYIVILQSFTTLKNRGFTVL